MNTDINQAGYYETDSYYDDYDPEKEEEEAERRNLEENELFDLTLKYRNPKKPKTPATDAEKKEYARMVELEQWHGRFDEIYPDMFDSAERWEAAEKETTDEPETVQAAPAAQDVHPETKKPAQIVDPVDAIKAMSKDERDGLIAQINATDPHNVFAPAGESRDPDKRKIICPKCANGTGQNATPVEASWTGDRWIYYCFKCGELEGDLLKIIATDNALNLNEFGDLCKALAIGAERAGIPIFPSFKTQPRQSQPPAQKKPPQQSEDYLKLIRLDVEEAKVGIQSLPRDQRRGLNPETLMHFKFGFIEQWIHPLNRLEGKQVKRSRRIIIPTSTEHYNAVALPDDRKRMEKKIWKMHAGSMELFNSVALKANDDLVVVVEGEIDAASLWQAFEGKISVVAVLGVANWKATLLPALADVTAKKFLIIFDGEPESRKKADALRGELVKRGFPAVCRFYTKFIIEKLTQDDYSAKKLSRVDDKTDANQILVEAGQDFLHDVTADIIADARADLDAVATEIANKPAHVDSKPPSLSTEPPALINTSTDTNPDDDDVLRGLKSQLAAVNRELADFDKDKEAALERLRNVGTFDNATVFAPDIVEAGAYAKLFDREAFSTFKTDVQDFGKKHPAAKTNLVDWQQSVKIAAEKIFNRETDLQTRRNKTVAAVNSHVFSKSNADVLRGLTFPPGYSVSAERGIELVVARGVIPVCPCPVIISGRTYNHESKIYGVELRYQSQKKFWRNVPHVENVVIANKSTIIALANSGLPVTSTNAPRLVDYLAAFSTVNENALPVTVTVPCCGWHKVGTELFIDPRRECTAESSSGKTCVVRVADNSTFAKSLRRAGTLDDWYRAYLHAQNSPVARIMVAAAVAPPLLKILGERNFWLHVYAVTRAGKTSALLLGAAAVGDEKIVRSFDATKNGLIGAAADVNDYPFLVDEKQVADRYIKEQTSLLIYGLTNGIGRTKLNRDSTLKQTRDWRTIVVTTGEAPLLTGNETAGAYTRTLSIAASKVILSPDDCAHIRRTIANNYGHVFPLVVNRILSIGKERLRKKYAEIVEAFDAGFPDVLPDHRRYVAVLTLADALLNHSIADNLSFDAALSDATIAAFRLFSLIPSTAEISDAKREADFLDAIISEHQNEFLNGEIPIQRMKQIHGKFDFPNNVAYVSAKFLREECDKGGFDYQKLVADLVDSGRIITDNSGTAERDRSKVRTSVKARIGGASVRCYKILISPDKEQTEEE